jgi:hypothetical protein
MFQAYQEDVCDLLGKREVSFQDVTRFDVAGHEVLRGRTQYSMMEQTD